MEILERASAKELEAAGHSVGCVVVRRVALLDSARNELLKQGRLLRPDFIVWLDDDARVEARTIRDMLSLDLPVLAAPVQMRGGQGMPNVKIIAPPVAHANGLQTVECAWLGLGCVLMRMDAVDRVWEHFSHMHYRSPADGKRSLHLFGSTLVPVKELDPDDTTDDNVLLGDDLIFSYRMRQAGLTLRALVQAVTQHADLPRYCLAEDERFFKRPA